MPTPEQLARKNIDDLLDKCGWIVQSRDEMNLGAGRGVAVREFPLKTGYADYLLFVDRRAIGAIEAKAEGATLTGVEAQAEKYGRGVVTTPLLPDVPLPFLYESTGVETFFTNGLDPEPRSRRTFAFHRPETLAHWAGETRSVRARLRNIPPIRGELGGGLASPLTLWSAQIEAIENLEKSLAQDRPRALIQMATGSGKTFTAVSFIYRLIKFAGARRVLFLVDRSNLGRQTLKEFQQYVTPDDGRKFTELYNVQHLQSNTLDAVSRVCITTIQRLYSMLSGEAEFDAELEEGSLFEMGDSLGQQPKDVRYNPAIPIEYFDFIVTDECHRSIYHLWRQVLEYFDASIIGLTATPSKQTFGFFNQNLVMEYSRPHAVADGVNVDGQVYRIRTAITERGSTVEAGYYVDKRDRQTRKVRWESLDEDLTYDAAQLDRTVVAEDQIRTIIRTYRDKLFTDLFPGRSEVPKTLIFAKDDSHAEDIVRIVREEFGKGNEFCQKITYRTTGVKPEELIASFRNSYHPRIAVTVDMIATGTDIKPLEVLLFMRPVKSRVLFEQMLGRGTRVINPTDLIAVTPDAARKTHFVIVDAIGVVEQAKIETQTLERKRSLGFAQLLEVVALGAHDEDTLSSLAGRLARLERTMTEQDRYNVNAIIRRGEVSSPIGTDGGAATAPVRELANRLLDAIDPDKPIEMVEVGEASSMEAARAELIDRAVRPFDDPKLRKVLIDIQARNEQTIDRISVDVVREAGFSAADTDRARATIESFRQFIEQHKDEIAALQLIYAQPYQHQPLTFAQVKELAEALRQPPQSWTTETLWQAYAQLERDKVRGVGAKRVLTDVVALVRHAVQLDDELRPYPEQVRARYDDWLQAQAAAGRAFTAEQRWWLDQIVETMGVNVSVGEDDLLEGEFFKRGGLVKARQVFGAELPALLDELNVALA
jgi:type I restriction enzyme R subunit